MNLRLNYKKEFKGRMIGIMRKAGLLALMLTARFIGVTAQSLDSGLRIDAEVGGQLSSGSMAPLWLSSNRYGVTSPYDHAAYERVGAFRSLETDSARQWRRGYGLDLMLSQNAPSRFMVHQAFFEVEWKKLNLSIGSKERPIELRNNELTSGGMSLGINAQPIPMARVAVDYFSIPFTNGWWKWKLHIAYGMTTDGCWQKDWVKLHGKYTSNTLYHDKSLYWKFGKEDARCVPLTFEIGLQMATQFGGKAYNVLARDSKELADMDLPENLKAFWNATTGRGRDATDFTESNAHGNTLGSYNMRLRWNGRTSGGKRWTVGAYFERFFEDQSMLTLQYGIQDHLIGLDATLPENPYLSAVCMEHISTRDQSGAVYHDQTKSIPDKMNGRDNYYNHGIYSGWQHWGMGIGNPLLISPVYNDDHTLTFYNNRLKAWHFGLSGDPTPQLHWRLMLTLSENWGTYDSPLPDKQKQQYYLAEVGWTPQFLRGWSGKIGFGYDHGGLLGNSFGTQLTFKYNIYTRK